MFVDPAMVVSEFILAAKATVEADDQDGVSAENQGSTNDTQDSTEFDVAPVFTQKNCDAIGPHEHDGVTYVTYAETGAAEYQRNENGMTYGSIDPRHYPENQNAPQLIAAMGTNGVEGYVYKSDLDGVQPNTPEEAMEYMENLEKQIARAKANGQEFSRYIPLYAVDGVTVIGEFGISYPEGLG